MYQLRPYQQQAVQATVQHFRKSHDPALVVLPTGAGKSLVIAELARIARGRVMVLAHVKELVEQNHAKYKHLRSDSGIFSAGLKQKDANSKVIFGSVQSIARNLNQFEQSQTTPFSLLIIDECHRVGMEQDSQYQQVINHLRKNNPTLKVLGMTATPYRLGQGWIYQYHYKGISRTDKPCFFSRCLYELPLSYMIDNNYLTPVNCIDAAVAYYDFSGIMPGQNGQYSAAELNKIIQGSKRATPKIIQQVQELSQARKGVMIFASTVEHAREIIGYLPAQETALVTGDTVQTERDQLINDFKQQKIKYLVNVSVLTTGFDAPHVDMIALLRPTESVSLYQQIVGRGLRLAENKSECLVIDYAGNTFDLFSPEVGEPRPDSKTVPVEVTCPVCATVNNFWGHVDSNGVLLEHFGRKCNGAAETVEGIEPCNFRFRSKSCEQCGEENDIAARTCHSCAHILVDPDKKLRDALNLRKAMVIRCSGMLFSEHQSKAGHNNLKITYFDPDGTELNEYYRLDNHNQRRAFIHYFVKQHDRTPGLTFSAQSIKHVIENQQRFRYPDFIIAEQQGKKAKDRFWQIREKIFDYQGAFTRADSAG